MACVCGHGDDNHEYPGGTCAGCYCSYYEEDIHMSEQDYEDLNRIEPGAGDYARETRRRFF